MVVEDSDEPVTNLYLNKVNLDYLSWQAVNHSDHQYAMLHIQPDFYRLHTDDVNRRFVTDNILECSVLQLEISI